MAILAALMGIPPNPIQAHSAAAAAFDSQEPTRTTHGAAPPIVPANPLYLAAVGRGRAIVDSLKRALSFPGLGVAVAVDGRVVWAEGFGFADIDREIPVDRHSVFPIYSVSKGFTALGLARLIERGEIDPDAPIQRYVPEFPEKEGGAVTPRLLAGHLAGIRHYRPEAGEGTRLRHCDTSIEAIEPFRDDPLIQPPGAVFRYTSYGFVLLSAAMARAAGQPFADLMEAEVFAPLDMTTAGLDERGGWVPNRVSTYEWNDSTGVRPARRMDLSCKLGAGGFLASAADVARGASAMFDGYVADETLDLLFTAQTNTAGEPIIEALGWDVGETGDGIRWVRRTGGNVDAWSTVMAYPESRVAVALLANMRGQDWIHDDAHRIALGFIAAEARAGPPPAPSGSPSLVLTNARIVDVSVGEVRPATVVIRSERIVAVGQPGGVPVPDDARVVDLSGRFLVPGLSEMHAHVGVDAFPLLVANGITTVRIMMGTDELVQWRNELEPNTALPRVFLAGPLMAGAEVPWPHELIHTPEEARASVRRQAAAGYDFIKVYEGLGADAYRAIVDEARRHEMPVAGHVPVDVGIEGVIEAGQRTIEHVEQLLYARFGRDGVMTLPFDRMHEVVERVAGADVFITPTLAGAERIHRRGTAWHEALYHREEMRWMDPSWAGWWSMGRGQAPSPEALERRRRFLLFQQELTAALHGEGVPLLTGTDTPYPLLVPGFSLHHEFEALTRVGLSPLDVLRAATVNAARALGRVGELGVIREGALADLVVVDRNPLEELSVLRRPFAVVIRGGYLDRATLDRMLAVAEPR